jgi:signal transduction histidine kinase
MNQLQHRRILLIDDLPSIHEDFHKILSYTMVASDLDEAETTLFGTASPPPAVGFELDSAYQGQEGVAKVRVSLQAGQPYALAFVDMRMPPGWDGIETIEHLWQEDPRLQVVICTAYSDYAWKEVLARLDMRDRLLILKKPFDNIEVCQLANTLTQKWALTRQTELQLQQLEEAMFQAKSAAKAKSEFLAVMSHEIRTPLNGVLGMAELLKFTQLTPEQQDYVNTVLECGQALMVLISDILDLSKIDAGKLTLEQSPFELYSLTDSVVRLFRPKAEEKQLALELLHPPGCLWLQGDATRVRQVLSNLLSNAIKFTHQGGVSVTVESQSLADGILQPSIAIRDRGIGMDEEQQSRLFASFEQADSSTTRRYGGTGLGLAICKQLANAMHGDIRVQSLPGAGSTFWLEWQAAPCSPPQPAIHTPHPPQVPTQVLQVLVVEDNPVNQKLIGLLLQRLGYADVVMADNGLSALQQLQQRSFDLILMDMEMPEMDGVETTRRIRGLPLQPQPYIVALTANAFTDDQQRCLAAGMNDFISKPINLNMLKRVLDTVSEQAPMAGAIRP